MFVYRNITYSNTEEYYIKKKTL